MKVVFAKAHQKPFMLQTVFTYCRTRAETLNQVFGTHHQALKAVDEAYSLSSVTQTDGSVVVRVPRPSREQQALKLAEQRHARRLAIH
jgi:transposase